MPKSVNGVQPVYVLLVVCIVALVAVLSDCSSEPTRTVTTTTNTSREQSNSDADVEVAVPERREDSPVERGVEDSQEDRLENARLEDVGPLIPPARLNESLGLRGLRKLHKTTSHLARIWTYSPFWFCMFLLLVVVVIGVAIPYVQEEWIDWGKTVLNLNVAKLENDQMELTGIVAKQFNDMQDVLDFLDRFKGQLTSKNTSNMKLTATVGEKIVNLLEGPNLFINDQWNVVQYIMDYHSGLNTNGEFDDFVRYVAENLTEEFSDVIGGGMSTPARMDALEKLFTQLSETKANQPV